MALVKLTPSGPNPWAQASMPQVRAFAGKTTGRKGWRLQIEPGTGQGGINTFLTKGVSKYPVKPAVVVQIPGRGWTYATPNQAKAFSTGTKHGRWTAVGTEIFKDGETVYTWKVKGGGEEYEVAYFDPAEHMATFWIPLRAAFTDLCEDC